MLYAICIIFGVLLGIFIGVFMMALGANKALFGTLKTAYDEDGNNPYLFLDMDKEPEEIFSHNYVIFKVDKTQPQK